MYVNEFQMKKKTYDREKALPSETQYCPIKPGFSQYFPLSWEILFKTRVFANPEITWKCLHQEHRATRCVHRWPIGECPCSESPGVTWVIILNSQVQTIGGHHV